MLKPQNWSQLAAETTNSLVAPAQALRPGVDGVIQFYDEQGVEYLAVNRPDGYGTETEAAFSTPRRAHVLEGADRGEDFSMFIVPEETLALRALTHGTGNRNHRTELLEEVYHDIGEILGNLGSNAQAKAPKIRVRDIAVDRLSGEILILPPLVFGKKVRNPEDYQDAFLKSVDKDFGKFWQPDTIERIKHEIIQGVEDGTRTA